MKKLSLLLIALFLSIGPASAQVGCAPLAPCGTPAIPANLNAAADPGPNNDQTQGYSIGSLWQNANTGRLFIARSVATASAVWTNFGLADQPGYIANNWYIPPGSSPIASGSVVGAGSIRLYPAYINERITLAALGVRVTVASAGGNVQAAVYKNNPATMRPTGTALVSTASMSTTTTASVNAAASVQLEPGMYWFASNTDSNTVTFSSFNSNSSWPGYLVGSPTQSSSLGNGTSIVGVSATQTFGTWPDLTSASFTDVAGASIPIVQFEVGSVP